MDIQSVKYIREFRAKIDEHFDLAEIKLLCFDLAVDYAHLAGGEKLTIINSLLTYLLKRGRLKDLLIILNEQRPNVEWPIPPSAEKQKSDAQLLSQEDIFWIRFLYGLVKGAIVGALLGILIGGLIGIFLEEILGPILLDISTKSQENFYSSSNEISFIAESYKLIIDTSPFLPPGFSIGAVPGSILGMIFVGVSYGLSEGASVAEVK